MPAEKFLITLDIILHLANKKTGNIFVLHVRKTRERMDLACILFVVPIGYLFVSRFASGVNLDLALITNVETHTSKL